jgi:hypothetical protein
VKKPRVIVRGTAAEAASHDAGYSGSGASMYSRTVATANGAAAGIARQRGRELPENMPLRDLIAMQEAKLKALRGRLKVQPDGPRRDEMRARLMFLTTMLDRMHHELAEFESLSRETCPGSQEEGAASHTLADAAPKHLTPVE